MTILELQKTCKRLFEQQGQFLQPYRIRDLGCHIHSHTFNGKNYDSLLFYAEIAPLTRGDVEISAQRVTFEHTLPQRESIQDWGPCLSDERTRAFVCNLTDQMMSDMRAFLENHFRELCASEIQKAARGIVR